MNEPTTLYDEYAEAFSFFITWTPFQTVNILFLIIIFYFYSGIAKRRTVEGTVVVLSSVYLGINQFLWTGFFIVAGWQGGEQVFSYGFEHFLPACSFYLGMIALLAIVCTTLLILKKRKGFARRKLISVLIAYAILMVGVTFSARTPIALQHWLDDLEPRVEKLSIVDEGVKSEVNSA